MWWYQLKKVLILIIVLIKNTIQQSILDGLINILEEGENQITNEPPDIGRTLNVYDFIIVGAGTAGCALANRLSENPNWTVLLIEAGRAENYLMDMPILANYLQFGESNWRYQTEPSTKYCIAMEGQRCNWPRGKVMGGSSVLNYMIYTRGNYRDYDQWAEMGNVGWSYTDVLPYFKKVENLLIQDELTNSTYYHSRDGYVGISYSPYKTKIADAVIKAAQQNGFDYVDYNGASQVGVSRLQVSMRDGVRESSSRAYLHPIRSRTNLHVRKQSTVSKLLIDPKTKRCYGLEYVRNGIVYVIQTRKEIILSAGAINSPQLLMLSGVGPKKHLDKLDIPVLSNLRVGYNLMDHIATGGLTFLIDKPYSLNTNKLITTEYLTAYLNYHQGPLSVPGGCETLVFDDLSHSKRKDGYPDIELLFQGGSIVSDPLLRKDFGIRDEIYDAMFKPIEDEDTFMVFPMLLRPQSRGRIMLKDRNYKTKPYIYPNYFANQIDMQTILKGIQLILNITRQSALKELGTRLHTLPVPQCAHFKFGTDMYFDCMTRHFTFTIYHQSGTCKMGPMKDRKAVVDPRLRVYGIKGLRVIDASIMPQIPAAHTNAPTFMIAEKGADMIKSDWGWNGGVQPHKSTHRKVS